jgi:hypothetical protein
MDTTTLLRALQEVEKRAERVHDDEAVMSTYVESGSLVDALMASDNGTIAGRRGTGKTHALRYLAERERQKDNFVIYIDVDKDLGSTEGIYGDTNIPLAERASRLLIDVLAVIHERLLEVAFANGDEQLIALLERVLDHFGEVLVAAEVESERSSESGAESTSNAGLEAGVSRTPGLKLTMSSGESLRASETARLRRTGTVRNRVHFGAVGDLMKRSVERLSAPRCWLLFDEWSSLPLEVQPYLAEMLRRLFFGVSKVTVRLAYIPHRTLMRVMREGDTGYLGLEWGAEIFPMLDLDEFVVFPARSREEQATRSAEFFRILLFRHLNNILRDNGDEELGSPEQMVSLLFTQVTALQEMIRAAEGVPRDALLIVARAALRAGDSKISTDHIRDAAGQVFQSTKQALLNGTPRARGLLDAIITEVISEKKARAFLLAPEHTEDPLITQLVDDRILHVIKRGYSSKDQPGTRFDVLQIDYGCYVQLLRTNSAPQGLLGEEGPDEDSVMQAFYGDVEVPEDDYRAIRRAVLDLPAVIAALGF